MKAAFKQWLKIQLPTILGAMVGIAVGYWYFLTYGCTTNACPITANPYKTSLLFGIMGGILGSYFPIQKKR